MNVMKIIVSRIRQGLIKTNTCKIRTNDSNTKNHLCKVLQHGAMSEHYTTYANP